MRRVTVSSNLDASARVERRSSRSPLRIALVIAGGMGIGHLLGVGSKAWSAHRWPVQAEDAALASALTGFHGSHRVHDMEHEHSPRLANLRSLATPVIVDPGGTRIWADASGHVASLSEDGMTVRLDTGPDEELSSLQPNPALTLGSRLVAGQEMGIAAHQQRLLAPEPGLVVHVGGSEVIVKLDSGPTVKYSGVRPTVMASSRVDGTSMLGVATSTPRVTIDE